MKPTSVASNSVFIEQGLIEIFGDDLNNSRQGVDVSQFKLTSLREAAFQTYGLVETCGMFLRAGRASFYYWMRQNSESLGWREVDFKLLPAPARIKRALEDALKWFEEESFIKSELSSTKEFWQIAASGLIEEGALLDCNLFIGFIQELASWAGAGKFFQAREIECQLDGAMRCLFEISKQPAG